MHFSSVQFFRDIFKSWRFHKRLQFQNLKLGLNLVRNEGLCCGMLPKLWKWNEAAKSFETSLLCDNLHSWKCICFCLDWNKAWLDELALHGKGNLTPTKHSLSFIEMEALLFSLLPSPVSFLILYPMHASSCSPALPCMCAMNQMLNCTLAKDHCAYYYIWLTLMEAIIIID